jgi:hypothetical protein
MSAFDPFATSQPALTVSILLVSPYGSHVGVEI